MIHVNVIIRNAAGFFFCISGKTTAKPTTEAATTVHTTPCELSEGMDENQLIPTDAIEVWEK